MNSVDAERIVKNAKVTFLAQFLSMLKTFWETARQEPRPTSENEDEDEDEGELLGKVPA